MAKSSEVGGRMRTDTTEQEIFDQIADELEQVAEDLRDEEIHLTESPRVETIPHHTYSEVLSFEVTYWDGEKDRTIEWY